MADREELEALRRLQELEAKASGGGSAVRGSEPLPSYGDMMKDSGLNVARRFASMPSPMALPGIIGGEALSNATKLLDRGAYSTGGAVTDALAPHVPPGVAAAAGTAGNFGVQAIPAFLGFGAGKAAEEPLKAAGRNMMGRALQPPSKALQSGDAAKAVQTMLDEGLNVTPQGAAKLRTMIDALNKKAAQEVAGSTATVSKAHPMSEVGGVLNRFRAQVNPAADEAAILEAWKEFSGRHGADIPVQLADAIKTGTQQILSKKYGQVGTASEAAQKAIARGLRLGIEEAVPSVAPINAQQSALINALKIAEPRAQMAGSRTLGGISPAAMNPEAMAAMAADRSTLIKSLLARLLYQTGQSRLPTAAGATLGTAIGTESGGAP